MALRRGTRSTAVLALASLIALGTSQLIPAGAEANRPRHVRLYRAAFESRLARVAEAAKTGARAPSAPVLDDFALVGHLDLGSTEIHADVWSHEDTAYVGTWGGPCTGSGVKVIDVSNPSAPTLLGNVAGIPGTSTEDVVVRSVSTPAFTGDLLVGGIQRCDFDDPALDDDLFGIEIWDVTDPANPVHFSHFGITTGGGGVHELDLFQRGGNVYAVGATNFSEWFDPCQCGDVQIVDLTDPANPALVGEWGAGQEGLSPGPFFGSGAFGAAFAHSVRASVDGTQVLASYWDLGLVTLDISDVTNPTFVSSTVYPEGADGDTHSVVEYAGASDDFLLVNDEDFDPRTPAIVSFGADSAFAPEGPHAPPLALVSGGELTARVLRPARQGCRPSDYEGLRVRGKIVVPRSFFPFFDPAPGKEPACRQLRQQRLAQDRGAVAVVHDFIAEATSPQPVDGGGGIEIPVLFIDHASARAMLEFGRATLTAPEPSWGFLRVFDAETGEQVATFDDLPNVHDLAGPPGAWSIHNTEVSGDRSYSAWYSHGIVALDLSPLDATPAGDPVLVGQFVPEPGASSPTPFLPDGIPSVWGVFVDPTGLVFASDMLSGLWIVDPIGDAAP